MTLAHQGSLVKNEDDSEVQRYTSPVIPVIDWLCAFSGFASRLLLPAGRPYRSTDSCCANVFHGFDALLQLRCFNHLPIATFVPRAASIGLALVADPVESLKY
jgi:hypothetical protein